MKYPVEEGYTPVIERDPPSWRALANCRGKDPNVFILDRGGSYKQALTLCSECVVVEPCLRYALDNHETGVWGGTTESQRKKMRRSNSAR